MNTPLIIRVRCNGVTYYGRHGRGKEAITATCTSGPEGAAKAVAAKVWKLGFQEQQQLDIYTERLPNPDPAGLIGGADYKVSAYPKNTVVEGGAS